MKVKKYNNYDYCTCTLSPRRTSSMSQSRSPKPRKTRSNAPPSRYRRHGFEKVFIPKTDGFSRLRQSITRSRRPRIQADLAATTVGNEAGPLLQRVEIEAWRAMQEVNCFVWIEE